MADVIREHIEIVPGPGGPKPRIAGHRIRVQDIAIWREKLGLSPDESCIASQRSRWPMSTPPWPITGTTATRSSAQSRRNRIWWRSSRHPQPVAREADRT